MDEKEDYGFVDVSVDVKLIKKRVSGTLKSPETLDFTECGRRDLN